MIAKRNANIDVVKFIAALLIMVSHIDIVLNCKCYNGFWIYVEMFFIITGYLTTRHFDVHEVRYNIKKCVQYTINKFIPIYPYIFLQVTLMYFGVYSIRLINGETGMLETVSAVLNNYFSELLLVSVSYGYPLSGQLWFVSAMFMVFPLFCIFVQLKDRYVIIISSSLFSMMYYGINESFGHDTVGGVALLRAVAGLCLGSLIYEWNEIGPKNTESRKISYTIIEIVTFILPILILINDISANRFILLCFIIQLSIVFSGKSYSGRNKSEKYVKVANYLGRLSVPIYVFHVLVGNIVQRLQIASSSSCFGVILYFAGTISLCIVIMLVFEKNHYIRKFMNWRVNWTD